MDSNLQTSFIPSKSLIEGVGKPKHTTNIFSLIATILFVTMLILAGAAFGYEWYQGQQITTAQTALQNEAKKFDPALITELSRLDSRIESVKTLMNSHLALSALFDYLGTVTVQNVRFTSFSYSLKNGANQGASIVLAGLAQNFTAVALQANEMNKPENQKYIQNPIFSDFNLDGKGNVTFSITATVPANQFNYRSLITAGAVMPTATVATTTASSTTQ